MSNVIYRGPIEREPQTVNLPVAGAYLPGIFVTSNGSTLTLAAAGTGRLFLLSNRRFYDQGLATAYISGETGVAYRLRPDDEFQARAAAATLAVGDPLTVNASGQLAAPAAGQVVVAYANEAGTFAANDLVDVVVANSYKF